jgi:hypothetical protein
MRLQIWIIALFDGSVESVAIQVSDGEQTQFRVLQWLFFAAVGTLRRFGFARASAA